MIPADARAFIAHDAGTCSPGSPPWTVSRSRTLGAGEWPADRAPALLDLRLNDGGWPAEDIRELEGRFGTVAHAPPPARPRRPRPGEGRHCGRGLLAARLTPRQTRLIALHASGMTADQIARTMNLIRSSAGAHGEQADDGDRARPDSTALDE